MRIETTPGRIPFAQYLDEERSRKIRHEYLGGAVYAMAGGSKRHNELTQQVTFLLRQHYQSRQCRVFTENLLVKIDWKGLEYSYYPDAMVVCDPDDNANEYFSEKPCVIVEVLSESTARIDRHEKLAAYQQIPTLMTYLIVSQQAMQVTLHQRAEGWKPVVLTQATDTVTMDCGGGIAPLVLDLATIYGSVLDA